jgi:putative membrane protein
MPAVCHHCRDAAPGNTATAAPTPQYNHRVRMILRVLLNAFALYVADYLLDGIRLTGIGSTLIAGLVLGIVNAVIRPVLLLLTLPFTLLTLGLFIFVVNAL